MIETRTTCCPGASDVRGISDCENYPPDTLEAPESILWAKMELWDTRTGISTRENDSPDTKGTVCNYLMKKIRMYLIR